MTRCCLDERTIVSYCQTREGSNEDRSLGHGNPERCTGGGQIIVCVSIIRRGAAAANYAVYCLPDCSTITHLTLNRLPLQHRREGFYNWISRSTICLFPLRLPGGGGLSPTGSSFVLRISSALDDGRPPGLPGSVSHSVPIPTRPCSDSVLDAKR